MAKQKQEEFRILTARQHVRERIGMYMGSSSKESIERFVLGEWKAVEYVPALTKMIDEILDNAIDEAIRTNFKKANKINVTVNEATNTITVNDNGRGIPHDKIHDEASNKKIQRPVAAWTRVNAGTSFDDERVTIGTNGVGSAATNFLSTSFQGKTWSGGNLLEVTCTDGGNTVNVKEKKRAGSGTEVSFTPDFSLFETNSLSTLGTLDLLEDRLISLSMSFPEIRFSLNNKRIAINDLKKYALQYSEDTVIDKSDNLSFFFAPSEDGFRTTSYINGVNTRQGGIYVEHLVNNTVDELITLIKRKHKIEVA